MGSADKRKRLMSVHINSSVNNYQCVIGKTINDAITINIDRGFA